MDKPGFENMASELRTLYTKTKDGYRIEHYPMITASGMIELHKHMVEIGAKYAEFKVDVTVDLFTSNWELLENFKLYDEDIDNEIEL